MIFHKPFGTISRLPKSSLREGIIVQCCAMFQRQPYSDGSEHIKLTFCLPYSRRLQV